MKRIPVQAAILAVLLSVVPGVAPVPAQPLGQATLNFIEARPADDRPVVRVRAYLTVTSDEDRPVAGLGAEAFEVLEDGRSVRLGGVERAEDPMSVVLAIDTSGSMLAQDKSGRTSVAAAKAAAAEFVRLLAPGDRVAVYTFNDRPRLELDFTADRNTALATIDAIQAKVNAGTCLYGTAFAAVKKSAEIPLGRRAIILLTDGRDEKGDPECLRYSAQDVIDAATTRTIRVPIYTIGAGPRVDREELDRIAAFTGGRHLLAASMDQLLEFYRAIAEQLKQQYMLRYDTQAPSGEHSLVVKVTAGGRTVQDEKRFWSPPPPVFPPPQVAFERPASGGVVKPGPVPVALRVTPPEAAVRVRYYVDGRLAAEKSGGDVTAFAWDASDAAGGPHVLRAEVLDAFQQSAVAEVTFRVERPAAPAPAAPPPPPPAAAPWPWIVLGGGVCLVAVVVVCWLWRRGRDGTSPGAAAPAAPEPEDETVFMPDDVAGDVAPVARLTVVKSLSLEPGTEFHFKGTARVGRTDRNDVDIPDKPVSRRHAEIHFDDGAYRIRDLGSRNGVKIDGQRIAAEGAVLRDGVRVELGPRTVLQFHCPQASPPDAPDDATRRYGD